jgi:valyl-tRNA synthetase
LGIKVRQPLSELIVGKLVNGLGAELVDLIREEMNVKSIRYDVNLKDEIKLDDRITPELKEEFILRETIRQIQEMRKEAGLKPRNKISVQYFGPVRLNSVLEKSKRALLKEARIKDMELVDDHGKILGMKKEVEVDQEKLFLGIKKI